MPDRRRTSAGFRWIIGRFGLDKPAVVAGSAKGTGEAILNVAPKLPADWRDFIRKSVHRHYWENDDNCAVTTIQTGAELFGIPIEQQVLDASLGLHGAGGYQAQCGLVEGGLMLIGILGRHYHSDRSEIAHLCRRYAQEFETRFGSLLCRVLRPGGFRSDDPPHLCEDLSRRAIEFTIGFLSDRWNRIR